MGGIALLGVTFLIAVARTVAKMRNPKVQRQKNMNKNKVATPAASHHVSFAVPTTKATVMAAAFRCPYSKLPCQLCHADNQNNGGGCCSLLSLQQHCWSTEPSIPSIEAPPGVQIVVTTLDEYLPTNRPQLTQSKPPFHGSLTLLDPPPLPSLSPEDGDADLPSEFAGRI